MGSDAWCGITFKTLQSVIIWHDRGSIWLSIMFLSMTLLRVLSNSYSRTNVLRVKHLHHDDFSSHAFYGWFLVLGIEFSCSKDINLIESYKIQILVQTWNLRITALSQSFGIQRLWAWASPFAFSRNLRYFTAYSNFKLLLNDILCQYNVYAYVYVALFFVSCMVHFISCCS